MSSGERPQNGKGSAPRNNLSEKFRKNFDSIKWSKSEDRQYTPETTEEKMSNTPRTDAFFNRTDIEWDDEVLFARQLERELAETKAEVERLNGQLKRVIEIADEFWNNQKQAVLIHHQELADELEQLKELEKSKSEIL